MFSARPLALLGTLALTACAVAPPSGPTVLAMPPEGKNLGEFQQEDAGCRNYASAQIGYGTPAQGANQAAVGSAALGTVLGAAAGALLGAAGGAAGTGAAVGAGTGLLAGSAIGGSNAQASGYALQQRYDMAYAQCMASAGNRVQAAVAAPPAGYGYSYPYYGGYPYYYGYGGYPYYWGYPYYYGPSVSLGFFGASGGRHFHHHHGFHGGGRHR